MRIILLAAPAALALTLSACASTAGPNRYQTDLDQMSADCQARGGILVPTGSQSGRPQADHACKTTGDASRIPRDR